MVKFRFDVVFGIFTSTITYSDARVYEELKA